MDYSSQLVVILVTICLFGLVAYRLKLAPPIAFLFGGSLLALMPWMSHIEISPEYMLLIFLPPILMEAAYFTSIRDFRANLRPILLLAIGLIIITACSLGFVVVSLLPGATWALGFVLGAIISPPDAAAATSALRGIRIPKRITSILEGESLVNDATAIVLYKFAVAAVVTMSFSFTEASLAFAWKALGGCLVGVLLAAAFVRCFRYMKEQPVEILSTLALPYAAYVLAEHVQASGVLAVVSAGFVVSWYAPTLFPPRLRVPNDAIWKMLVYALNALAFLLIGLQLPKLIVSLSEYPISLVIGSTVAVCAATCITRFVYVFLATYGARYCCPWKKQRAAEPAWQNVFVIAWTGLRGVVTLALALALPRTLADGSPFPYRDLLIFLSMSVILFTLVFQGATLPWLVRKLTLSFDPKRAQEEWLARVQATRAALKKLDELAGNPEVYQPALQRIREHYEERLRSLADGPNTPIGGGDGQAPSLMNHPLLLAENRIWQEVLLTERETVVSLRKNFTVSDDVMHELFRDMDLLANRFRYEFEKVQSPLDIEARFARWRRLSMRRRWRRA